MSSNSVVSLSSFNLLFFTQVLTVLTSSIKYNEYVTDKGKNISIPCIAEGNIMWVKENGNNSTIIQTGKFLVFTNVSETDRGLYICFASVPIQQKQTNTSSVGENVELEALHASANTSTNDAVTTTKTTKETSLPTSALPPTAIQTTSTIVSTVNVSITTASTTSPFSVITKNSTTTNGTTKNRKIITQNLSATIGYEEEQEFQAILKVNLKVRTTPGPVTQLYFKASTILGFLIWRFNKSNSGGYPLRSFTAEMRNITYKETPYNSSFEHHWSTLDPVNIAPNVRQMEVYRLAPNTTYEFRIRANNHLGSGETITTNVTTLPETKEEDLIRLIQPDLDNFDPRIWIVAVSIVLGTLVILAIGLCIVLSKECYQASHMGYEDGWDSIELLPNIILNPGFSESEGEGGAGPNHTPYPRTIIFGGDDDSDYSGSTDSSDDEPRMEKFKRKVSVFFTGPTIKRI